MIRKAGLFLLLLVAASVLVLTGCPDRTSIADIEANPSKYENKQVAVAGTVKDSYGVSIPGTNIRGGAYKIDDGTGSIWVISEETVPPRGVRIGVKGRVASAVNWNGKNYGLGMYEQGRRKVER